MPRIHPLSPTQTPPEVQAAFDEHVATYQGRITHMKATLGHSLTAFEAYMQWYPLYGQVRQILGERLAYLFAHAISLGTNCPLCTTFFRRIIIENGESPEHLAVSEAEQSVLELGSQMAQHQGRIAEEVYRRVAGQYAPAQMVILLAFAGQMIATNVFNNAVEVELDPYLIPYQPPVERQPS